MYEFLFVGRAAPCRITPIRLGLAGAMLAITAPAQVWQQVQPPVHPRALIRQSMVFDAARDVVLLFGGQGYSGPNFSEETWAWNGVAWALLQPNLAPPGRESAGMVYDSARQRVVLFGGGGMGLRNDTWEWDGVDWLQRTPLHVPAPRSRFGMAYDTANARTVLFGGYNGRPPEPPLLDDTWTWDGSDWTQLAPAHSPSARLEATMTYDHARARCVLFGGSGESSTFDDTWEWDGVDWTQRATAHAPRACTGGAIAYDTANHRVVLFGGYVGPAQDFTDETWEYDGNDWAIQVPLTAPHPRQSMNVAYDATRANLVMFGGTIPSVYGTIMDDTWLFTHAMGAATFTPFGQGCPGSVGMPQLALASGLPIVGTMIQVACTNLELDHFTTMWIGFSKRTWMHGSLPYDLGPIGMPGCTLFVSADIVSALLNWNGTAFWQMPLPNAPQLVGLPFYLQAGVIDHVNTLGMVVTNAAEVRVGDH